MTTGHVYHPIYLEHNLPSHLAEEQMPFFEEHGLAGHPENSTRLVTIMARLEAAGLLARLIPIEGVPVSMELLCRVHDASYISLVESVAKSGGGMLDPCPDPATYVNAQSYDAALMAAGGAVVAVDAVLGGQVDNAFALVRPPGHHAGRHVGSGFCLFNNAAIAAQHALESGLERVLIVDYDVHHGNGTQDIFYERDDVLYFSIHQYPNCPWTGHWEERGQGVGEGYTVNVPLPWSVGDEVYERVFQEFLRPLVQCYAPQLILVSAGYDAHWSDPIGNPDVNMRLSTIGYYRLAEILVSLADEQCQGRLVFVLEGGYNPEALSHSVLATFAALLGEEAEDPLGPSPHEEKLSTFFWADYPAFRSIAILSGSGPCGSGAKTDLTT